tara:strand:+ start:423 stop:1160 length:738 start_codon:yes stop_codon:yes gene_type:complete
MDENLKHNLPAHIAIVMDGNGRWAESRGLPRVEGHKVGLDVVKNIVQCCIEKEIPCLSLFAFSSENWRRPQEEVSFLMELFLHSLQKEAKDLHGRNIKLVFTGDRDSLSSSLIEQMRQVEYLTSKNSKLTLNIVLNYSGQWDILQASKQLIQEVVDGRLEPKNVNEVVLNQRLATSQLPDPDLFIRTSGEKRISNFFLWQLAYTELFFTDVLWPDFSPEVFDKALVDYSLRERRYGQTSKQVQGA